MTTRPERSGEELPLSEDLRAVEAIATQGLTKIMALLKPVTVSGRSEDGVLSQATAAAELAGFTLSYRGLLSSIFNDGVDANTSISDGSKTASFQRSENWDFGTESFSVVTGNVGDTVSERQRVTIEGVAGREKTKLRINDTYSEPGIIVDLRTEEPDAEALEIVRETLGTAQELLARLPE